MLNCKCNEKHQYLEKYNGLPSIELRQKFREKPPKKLYGFCHCCKTSLYLRPWSSVISDNILYCVECWWINRCYLSFIRIKYKDIVKFEGRKIEEDISKKYGIKLPKI